MMEQTIFSGMLELFSFVWTEAYMFGIAALVYMAFSGGLDKFRFKASKCEPTNKKTAPEIRTEPRSAGDVSACQAIAKLLRQGDLDDALQRLVILQSSNGDIPVVLGSRLLAVLARTQRACDLAEQVSQVLDKCGAQALELAIVDALKRGDVSLCRHLREVSDLLMIPKTPGSFELFAKTHSPDAQGLQTLVAEMHSSNVVFTKSLVEAVLVACATTKDSELAAELVARVEVPRADRDLCCALIRVYLSCEQWDMACCIYEEVMLPAQLKVDNVLAESLLKAAEQAERPDLVPALSASLVGDSNKQAKLIREHGKSGNLKAAFHIFSQMEQSKVAMNSLVYNSILEACAQCGDSRSALAFFEQAKSAGHADVVSYNTVMKGHLAEGKMDMAHQLLKEMTDNGMPASLVTYHGLLKAKVQSGDSRAAWRLVDEMVNVRLAPNAVTCSILLKTCTNNNSTDLARVMDLINSMDASVDEVLFASVAEACIRTGRLDLLSKWARQHKRSGGFQNLSAPTYGSMIKAYGQARDVDQVWALWEEMMSRQVQPTSITLGCMVEALVMNRCTDPAWDLVQKLWKDENHKTLLNTVIYSTILKGFAMSKQPDRLQSLYEEMQTRGIPCNTITYNTMLNAFAQCGAMHRVPQLLEDMKAAAPPVEPDIITYSTMVKGFCAVGDLDKGLQLLQAMELDGKFAPDEVMYNSLLDGCAKQHRLDDALKLLSNMRTSGVAPSNYTLSIMVKLLGRARRLKQAFSTVKELCEEYGFRANIQVYTCLIQACFHNRHHAKAIALLDQIIQEGVVPDQKTYVSLVRGCLQAGVIDKAAEVVRAAHHAPGHTMLEADGAPPGVDARTLQEVMAKLGPNSGAARQLTADLKIGESREGGDRDRDRGRPRAAVRSAGGNGPTPPWRTRTDSGSPSSDDRRVRS